MGRMKSRHTHLPRHLRVSRGAYYHLTGLRRGDLLALRVMAGGDAGIGVRIGKTGAVRVIEWTDALHACIYRAFPCISV